jgi:hypothetical protein
MSRIYLVVYFLLVFTISATDFEYPTLINPDGTIQVREFSKEQKFTFDSLKKEIAYFQAEISKILPYLIRNGKVKNNSYTKEIRNFIETQPGRRNQHFVYESFMISLTDGRLSSISFIKRRTRLNPKMETETVIRYISNDTINNENPNIKLKIDTHTNYTESSSPNTKVFSMSDIPSPVDRIKLMRTYRTKVEEALRELDRIVDHKMLNDHTIMSNTLNDIELE